jgi:hypothetical protein
MLQRLDTTDRPETPEAESRSRTVLASSPPARPRLELSVPKVLAGALAAASAAVAASWLGVGGTVAGAVIASVVVSVTTALYAHPLERSSQVIRETLPVVPTRYRASDAAGATETMVLDAAEPQPEPDASAPADRPSRRISWAAVALSSIVILVVGLGVVTGVEALLGRPVSALTGHGGGTTISHLVGNSQSDSGDSDQPSNGEQGGDPTGTPTTGQTDAPTTDAPTTDEPTPTEPTEPTDTGPTTAPATGDGVATGDGAVTVAP